MKINDKFMNLRCFWLSKCLIILSIIIFNTSCEKENINFEKENNNTTIGYGIPDLEDLLKNFPNFYLDNNIIKIRNLYVQRFDLIYDIKTE